jgi:transcriptional regulator with XRE-family HTH domain
MTTDAVPDLILGDRLRVSLRHAGITAGDMAEYLGVGRNTVSTWMNGHITPRKQSLRLWAMRTGVSLEWLETGWSSQEVRHQGLEPRTRWLTTGAAA